MTGSDAEHRLPVAVVGAGAMGGAWIRMLAASPVAVVVGVVDLAVNEQPLRAGLPALC